MTNNVTYYITATVASADYGNYNYDEFVWAGESFEGLNYSHAVYDTLDEALSSFDNPDPANFGNRTVTVYVNKITDVIDSDGDIVSSKIDVAYEEKFTA